MRGVGRPMRLVSSSGRAVAALGLVALGAAMALAPSVATSAPGADVRIVKPSRSVSVVSGKVPVQAFARRGSGICFVQFRIDGKQRWVQRTAPWRFGGGSGRVGRPEGAHRDPPGGRRRR